MKTEDDDLLPEYDFSKAVHGMYYERYQPANAIEERERQERRSAAIDAILELHREQPPLTDEEIEYIRKADRP